MWTESDEETGEVDGTIISCIGNGVYEVDIGGETVNANMSGKLRMNYIRLMPGDRVRVDHPEHQKNSRITWRYKSP